jgi:hypothetical protein
VAESGERVRHGVRAARATASGKARETESDTRPSYVPSQVGVGGLGGWVGGGGYTIN